MATETRFRRITIFALALACALLAVIWPQWRSELQGYGYYTQTPYFGYCHVKSLNTPGVGAQTFILAEIHHPTLPVPGGIVSVTVEGPEGFPTTTMTPADYAPVSKRFITRIPNTPLVGQYVFTVLDTAGESATSYYYLSNVNILPIADSTSFKAYYSTLTPTLTWSDFPGYNGNLVFQANIYDAYNYLLWTSAVTGKTTIYVPSTANLQAGVAYKWSVAALDDAQTQVADNWSESDQIPLALSAGPGFTFASVYSLTLPGMPVATALDTQVAGEALPVGISSLVVTGPGGATVYSFQPGDFNSQTYEYYVTIPSLLPDGMYTFTVTDTAGKTAASCHYFKHNTVPRADETTLQASGNNALAPTLTWAAPAGTDKPLFYSVTIWDKDTGYGVWRASGLVNPNCVVSSGYLLSGHNYQWRLDVQDTRSPYVPNNVARTNKVDLVVDNTKPNFLWGAGVFIRNDPGGVFTGVDTPVNDPSPGGAGLSSSMSLVATGPNSFSYTFVQGDLVLYGGTMTGQYEYYHAFPGKLPDGTYTFTLSYPGGQLVTHDTLQNGVQIPIADETTFQVTGNPLAPTVSWNAIAGYPGHLYYRLKVEDSSNATIYNSSRTPLTYQTVPANILQSGQTYKYRVEVQEDPAWIVYNNRSDSHWFLLLPTQDAAPGAPTGAQAAAGNGQAAVSFQAPAYDGGSPITGYTVTSIPDGMTGTGTGSPIIVAGLTNGKPYTFTVTATNAIGTGSASVASNSVTPSATCLANLAGTWFLNSFAAGPGAPWWDRGPMTINPDGTFTTAFVQSDGTADKNPGGTLWVFPNGLLPYTAGSHDHDRLCRADMDNTLISCTGTWGDGTADLAVLTKQAASYLTTNLAGPWQGNILFSGPTPSWTRVTETINGTTGTFQGTYSTSGGTQGKVSGIVALSANGQLTCVSGSCKSTNYLGFMDAGKTIMVGTSGASTTAEDAQLSIYTKKASTYSLADLAGIWESDELRSNPNAGWHRSSVLIHSDGTFTTSGYASDGTTDSGTGGLAISSAGVITCVSGDCLQKDTRLVMDAGKTVAVGTRIHGDGSDSIEIVTKKAAPPGAPTGVKATAGIGQVTVSFKPPVSNGAPITSYTVTSNPGGVTVTGTGNSIIVKNLLIGTSYTFTVTATNAAGTSKASIPSNIAIPATLPDPPINVQATQGSLKGTVVVTFSPPTSDGYSPITAYTATSNPGKKTAKGPGTPLTVTGLTTGISYTFTVTATTKMGTGQASSHSNSVTAP